MSAPEFPADVDFLSSLVDAARWLKRSAPERETMIGTGGVPLSKRLIVRRTPESCIYVHEWLRSDPDELHDHPWDNCSIVLRGGYWDVTPEGRFWRLPGSVTFRKAEDRHRIEIEPGELRPVSLFITGREVREWGFHTPDGFVIGRDYRALSQRALVERARAAD